MPHSHHLLYGFFLSFLPWIIYFLQPSVCGVCYTLGTEKCKWHACSHNIVWLYCEMELNLHFLSPYYCLDATVLPILFILELCLWKLSLNEGLLAIWVIQMKKMKRIYLLSNLILNSLFPVTVSPLRLFKKEKTKKRDKELSEVYLWCWVEFNLLYYRKCNCMCYRNIARFCYCEVR